MRVVLVKSSSKAHLTLAGVRDGGNKWNERNVKEMYEAIWGVESVYNFWGVQLVKSPRGPKEEEIVEIKRELEVLFARIGYAVAPSERALGG